MKSTILYIIVKQWFKDKSGVELDDAAIDAIIKELTEERGENPYLKAKEEVSEWIGVCDRMPKEGKFNESDHIMIKTSDGKITQGFTNKGLFYSSYITEKLKFKEVTHWRPLLNINK